MSALIVPDIHQDLAFLELVLEKYPPADFDRLIFLGDYFWTNNDELHEADRFRAFCQKLSSLHREFSDKTTFLCGNRDLPYLLLSSYPKEISREDLPAYLHSFCRQDAVEITRVCIPQEFWECLQCATTESGWLLSHAGVSRDFLPNGPTELAVQELNQHFRDALIRAKDGVLLPILQAGKSKNGPLERGGPLWQVFTDEFEDTLPLPQIVGHTRGKALRSVGRSHCIDCGQKAVAIIEEGQRFSFQLIGK